MDAAEQQHLAVEAPTQESSSSQQVENKPEQSSPMSPAGSSDSAVLVRELKAELSMKEAMLKLAKEGECAAAQRDAAKLTEEVAALRQELGKHKPLKAQVKSLTNAVKWRSERLEVRRTQRTISRSQSQAVR